MPGEDLAHEPRVGRAVRGRRGGEVADVVLPAARRVQVEEAHGPGAPVGERVHDARRHAGVRARRRVDLVGADPDRERPLEDVERVEQLAVGVGWGAARARLDGHLGEREEARGRLTGRLEEGGGRPDLIGRSLAGAEDGAAAGLLWPVDVDAVERARLPPDGGAQEVGEVGVGSVDVEEANSAAARVRERMDDTGWRDDGRPGGGDDAGLAADGELELALEDVEGVGVALVVVRARTRVVRAGLVLDEAELGPRDLDEVRPVVALEELALIRPVDDRLIHLPPVNSRGTPLPPPAFQRNDEERACLCRTVPEA